MSLLVIDISDKIEELGILFANLLEDCLLNESIQSQYDLNNDYEQQDSSSPPAENSLCLPSPVDHVPGDAQPGEYRAAICPRSESHRLRMEPFTSTGSGWRPGPFGQQYGRTRGLQDLGSSSIYGYSGGDICTGGLPAFQKFCRLESFIRTLFAYPDPDHRSGWLLRSRPIQRSAAAGIERHHVPGGTSSNKSPPVWRKDQQGQER